MAGKNVDKNKALENWEKQADKIAAGKDVVVKKAKTFSLPLELIDKLRIHSATVNKDQSLIMSELLEEYFKKNRI
ncbi:MAG TPA: hypothetical protein PKV35_09840 [bacterium]|jgi:hypothetical protein|nr:hypothetical protein [bacterium]